MSATSSRIIRIFGKGGTEQRKGRPVEPPFFTSPVASERCEREETTPRDSPPAGLRNVAACLPGQFVATTGQPVDRKPAQIENLKLATFLAVDSDVWRTVIFRQIGRRVLEPWDMLNGPDWLPVAISHPHVTVDTL